MELVISNKIGFEVIDSFLDTKDVNVILSDYSKQRVAGCRDYLDRKLLESDRSIYGINTGFGALCETMISSDELELLQKNLVMSHACGTGDEVPPEIVKLMMLLKIQSLSYGNSGVQLQTVERLAGFLNAGITPVVYQQGSLGASGDLSPLAHMSLPLLGLGEVYYNGKRKDAATVLQELGWKPLTLKSKEGLALLNGTQFMSAYGVYCCLKVFRLSQLADIIAALSLDAFFGLKEPFHENIQKIRPHRGQIVTAARISSLLEQSEIMALPKQHVQDPYSFRCIPQVHGASKDSIDYVSYVFDREMNSVTDNPTIFPEDDLIISAGNFHGQPLALALDNLCIAMSELGNISERRTYQLLAGKRGLPPFLVANPGLNSGFMIPQYTAASIVNQNKMLSTPSSVDSIESSQGQEDHVSMGANAATKAFKVLHNLETILAIELFNAAQAFEFRRPLKTSPFLEEFFCNYRDNVQFIKNDKVMYDEILKSISFLREVSYHLPGSGSKIIP